MKAVMVLEEITDGHGFRWIEWSEEYDDWKVNEEAQQQIVFTRLFVTVFENGPSILLKTGNLVQQQVKVSNFWAFSVLLSVHSFVGKSFESYESGLNGRYNSWKAIAGLVGLFGLIALIFYLPLFATMRSFAVLDDSGRQCMDY